MLRSVGIDSAAKRGYKSLSKQQKGTLSRLRNVGSKRTKVGTSQHTMMESLRKKKLVSKTKLTLRDIFNTTGKLKSYQRYEITDKGSRWAESKYYKI